MRTLRAYIARAAAVGILVTLSGLVVIDAVFVLISELDDIGRGDYTMMDAFHYLLLVLPSRAYEMFPSAALLGVLLGMGALAARSEVVAMRAAGISRLQMAVAAIYGACWVLAPMWLAGEYLAPEAEQRAQQMRVYKQEQGLAITPASEAAGSGFWIRVGERFIHVRQVLGLGQGRDSLRLEGVVIYEFDQQRLARVEVARQAAFEGGAWLLEEVLQTDWSADVPVTEWRASRRESQLLNPELLEVVVVKPRYLSSANLWRYASYLRANGLDARQYEVAFWSRVMYPFTALAMVFAAMPFIFATGRQGGVGQRMFIGVVVGLGFFVFQRTAVSFGDVYRIDPLIAAVSPTLALVLLVGWALRRGR